MISISQANKSSVIKVVQELLNCEIDKSAITPALIEEKISLALMINKKWAESLDREAVTDELIRRYSVWIGQDTLLVNNEGHEPWLKAERKQDWRYWQRYREFQEAKLPWTAVEGLDSSTDKVLGLLEDPERKGPWDRRGLVVGHVQSGKTGNYTGLICKAADAGYKIIIVLAGMHNNLRSQTQMRLDEGFLGYETNPLPETMKIIGVGNIDGDPTIRPNYATNRSDKGDFNSKAAKHLGISPEQRPWLFVVKKNKAVLQSLHKWIQDHVSNAVDASGRKIVTHLPLLVIDDEADNASVDTGEQLFNQDGTPDEAHQPKAINRLIRQILHTFQRKSYVGYTATPFANIFIHERGETSSEGPDLFPAAFIFSLATPSNYIGPARVFGLDGGEQREGGLPLIRTVSDHCSENGKEGWIPTKHKNGHLPCIANEHSMPNSLVAALDSFILSCATRSLRGHRDEHSSMLIHVTRFNSVQTEVFKQVDLYIQHINQRLSRKIGHEEVILRLKNLWEEDFIPTTKSMNKIFPDSNAGKVYWGDIESLLVETLSEISVRMINGTAKDALDYSDSAGGLKVIAIGGDKLARGLTLEGLCVSYFLRASRMYDTLMQMGRWFGYRPGYLDLCRLFTTDELVEWFEHIADASEELREEFDLMVDSGGTPREYGLKVISHPVLMVTSRLKMRAAKSLYLSFSGHVIETVSMHNDKSVLNENYRTFEKLVGSLGPASPIPDRQRNDSIEKWKGAHWEGVPAQAIMDFLSDYQTHPEALKANSRLLSEFIESMSRQGELTSWTIAVISGGQQKTVEVSSGYEVALTKRASKELPDRYSIRRLLSPKDEGIDLDETAWMAALEETQRIWHDDPGRLKNKFKPEVPNGPSLRRIRGFGAKGLDPHPERGLMLIYLLDPEEAKLVHMDVPVVAFGISFPGSNSGTKVEYKVNNVLWERNYGSSD